MLNFLRSTAEFDADSSRRPEKLAKSRLMRFFLLLMTLLMPLALAQAQQPLQPWLDTVPAGGVLRLLPGVYRGPAVISKPITLEGDGKVVIDGGGQGTVLTVKASDVTLRGLRLQASGGSHDALDAGVMLTGERLRFENNVVDDVLFGVLLHGVNDSVVRNNRIRSRPVDAADRGDGMRVWNGSHNLIADNDIAQIRDITISNAPRNRFIGNTVRDSRRAFNLLFAHRSLIENNLLDRNSTGIVTLNSDGIVIRNNRIMHAMDPSGAGVALKETAAALVVGNDIVHCAHGIMADSPMHPINRISFLDNRLAHNVTGLYFYGERGGHIAIGNRFENNLWQVTVIGNGPPESDIWWGNYWDDYQGFDRNHDGIGDTPHEIYTYADRIWLATPQAKFFRNAPVLELLDFLEKLAPFSAPDLVLRDRAPRMRP